MIFRIRRSAGVTVAWRVHRLLRQANSARDRRDWEGAAILYGAALRRDPSLGHIRIQHGHALKELGRLAEAEAAYHGALAGGARNVDAELNLGHVRQLQGDVEGAVDAYARAYRSEPMHPDTCNALCQAIEHCDGDLRERLLAELIAELAIKPIEAAEQNQSAVQPAAGAVVFEVTDLLHYFGHARLPTGIQRVQIETVAAALRDPEASAVRLCTFSQGVEPWLDVPNELFEALAARSVESDDRTDPSWVRAFNRLRVTILLARPLAFPTGGTLVNLGTSWGFPDYFLHVRNAKERFNIRFVPLVYDLVPVIAPEFCVPALRTAFGAWIIEIFDHADFFLAISESTKADLIATAQRLGYTVRSEKVCVIPLDADFRDRPVQKLGSDWALPDGIGEQRYVLFVGTIEPRKNHLLAFRAWAEMLSAREPDAVPLLVCVGRRGWLNDAVYAYLAEHPAVRDKVVMLAGVADAMLAYLYERSLFTLYPSFYEGWGLPVTESLCYGKVPLVSDSSSMPQAGGDLAVYFRNDDCSALVAALTRLIFDPGYRPALERRIAERFSPRGWAQIGKQIAAAVTDARSNAFGSHPEAELERYYPMRLPHPNDLQTGTRSGIGFRIGRGWQPPDAEGSPTRAGGGDLRIGLPAGCDGVRVSLRLRAPSSHPIRVMIRAGAAAGEVSAMLAADQSRWVEIEIDRPPADCSITLKICVVAGSDPRPQPGYDAVLLEGLTCSHSAVTGCTGSVGDP